jgi:putative addiction module component (TIGR02574 family)
MSNLLTELSHRAQALPPEERAQLAEVLLESLHKGSSPEVEAAWDQELEARIASYERGEAKAVPAEDVFAEARRLTE